MGKKVQPKYQNGKEETENAVTNCYKTTLHKSLQTISNSKETIHAKKVKKET